MTSEASPSHASARPNRRNGAAPSPDFRTSSATWLAGVLSMFEAEGIDVPSLLREAGFDPETLRKQNARIPVDEITVLWRLAIARNGRPTLGLSSELATQHSQLGTVGHVMAASSTLGEALRRVVRYIGAISDATCFTFESDARGAWLSIEHTGGTLPIPRQRVEYALLTLLVQCRWLARRELQPMRAEFVFDVPVDDRPHREAFGCDVRFNAQANRILVAHADLAMPLPTHHPDLLHIQEGLLDSQLDLLGQTTTSTLVCAEITRRLPDGEPRRQDVASALGLAERTLQRRLQEESVSYQALLDRTRRELAQKYLSEDRHTLTAVADLLGFVDGSNFFRACKRWFGMPPAQYRQQIRNSALASPGMVAAASD